MVQSKAMGNRDLLSGALLPRIIWFSLPLMATGILQLLFNTADTIVVGRFGGATPEECETALAAVGSCGSLTSVIINLFMGLSVGTGVCAAQSIGARREDEVERVVHTSVVIALILGTFVSVAGMLLSQPLLTAMGTDKTVLPHAVAYIVAYFAGAPANMLYNYCAAILRSKGDTTRPLLFLTVAGVSNVILNLVMVLGFHLGALGVGIATAASHWISCILITHHMMHLDDICRIDVKKLKIHRQTLSKVLYIGIPAGIQGTVFSFSNVMLQSAVNSFGRATVAANTAANNITDYGYIAQNTIYHAALTFVGQGVGARRHDRVRAAALTCTATVAVVGLITGLLSVAFGEQLLSIFSPGNTEIIRLGMVRIRYMCLPFFLCGIMEVGSGILRGLGKSVTSMIVSITGICGTRLIWILIIFRAFRSLDLLYFSYPVTWTITSCTHFAFAIYYIRKMKKSLAEEPIEHPVNATGENPI